MPISNHFYLVDLKIDPRLLTAQEQYKYPARISFPGTPLPAVEFSSVFGAQLREQGLVALIGRDLLSLFVLTYNGPGGFVTLAY